MRIFWLILSIVFIILATLTLFSKDNSNIFDLVILSYLCTVLSNQEQIINKLNKNE